MAKVFVSHASEDIALACELHRWLVEAGHEVFLDRDLRDGIAVGEDWEQQLQKRLRWAKCDGLRGHVGLCGIVVVLGRG